MLVSERMKWSDEQTILINNHFKEWIDLPTGNKLPSKLTVTVCIVILAGIIFGNLSIIGSTKFGVLLDEGLHFGPNCIKIRQLLRMLSQKSHNFHIFYQILMLFQTKMTGIISRV